MNSRRPTGMQAFTVVWLGQFVSFLGTGMTRFALTIWAWQVTGSATALALVGFFSFGPIVLLSPVAGVLVDRSNRKLAMMLSDLGAGLATTAILLLYVTGHLQVWHLYIASAFAGAFESFQFPAYSAAVTMMVRKQHYARASGMLSLAGSASSIFAPLVAGAMLGIIGVGGIMVIDVITFLFAISALLTVHVPQPTTTEAGQAGQGTLWQESAYGFRYIFQRPSLLGLQLVFFAVNLIGTFGFTVMAPMILARTGNNELILGTVQSTGAVGGVAGGLLLSLWGGPKRRVHGVLLGITAGSLLGQVVMGLGNGIYVWSLAAFCSSLFLPILNGSNQAIWQSKVAPDVQGRVFAARRLIAQITAPIAMLMAGPLADYMFEPAMMPGGRLVPVLDLVIQPGPGAGMALMFVIAGILGAAVGLSGYAFPAIRNAEDILPDHDAPTGEPVGNYSAEFHDDADSPTVEPEV